MTETHFWHADVRWENEPIEQLRRLHSLLAVDRGAALSGLEALASQGSLAAAIYIAMELDRLPAEKGDTETAARWYAAAAAKGSRAATYRLGILRAAKGDLLGAEAAFRMGDSQNFPPSMYCLACLYIDDTQGHFSSKNKDIIRDILERSSKLGHLFSIRDLATFYLNGKLWPRRPFRGLYLLCKLFLQIPKAIFEAVRGSTKADEMLRG